MGGNEKTGGGGEEKNLRKNPIKKPQTDLQIGRKCQILGVKVKNWERKGTKMVKNGGKAKNLGKPPKLGMVVPKMTKRKIKKKPNKL